MKGENKNTLLIIWTSQKDFINLKRMVNSHVAP